MAKITAADAGTWLDGTHGWTNGYRCVERALSYGWEMPQEWAQGWDAFVNLHYGESDAWEDLKGDDGSFVDEATDYLQSLAPETYVFRWDMGELSLTPVWVDCEADGGGCETEIWNDGSEHLEPCPDHKPDNVIRVVPKVLGTGFSVYTVMLWDESGEVMSGEAQVTLSPAPKVSPTGESWFPEFIAVPEIRAAAEKLIRITRCEGHADDDETLLSGAGIGESIRCDGSCQL